jgi:outer membrane protein insertion porin family
MKDITKTFRILKASKFIKTKYKTDLEKVIAYKEKGYRDARILSDTITYLKEKNTLSIKLNVEEINIILNIKFLGKFIQINY